MYLDKNNVLKILENCFQIVYMKFESSFNDCLFFLKIIEYQHLIYDQPHDVGHLII